MNRLTIGLAALAVAGCGTHDLSDGDAAVANNACTALTGLEMANTEITRSEEKPVGSFSFGAGPGSTSVELPTHCYVEGISNERTGADGKTYGLGFALAMPADWNGRFLFQGGGGLNGTVHPPLGGNAAGDKPALARGFAVISTDGGLYGRSAGRARFFRTIRGQGHRTGRGDCEGPLRAGRASYLYFRLLDRRAREHAGRAALSHAVRWCRGRCAGHAHRKLKFRPA